MPRKPRLHVPGGVYHVILRGNHQEPLFGAASERAYLNTLVGDVVTRFGLRVFAYCWMTNHLHLAVRVGDVPLARPMQRLARAYSRHVHRNAGLVGHLFERRYRSILVDADSYLLALVRYIHLNPVVAGMVDEPAAYRWSSHRDYLGRRTVPWVDADFVLAMFGPTVGVARVRYARFMRSYTDEDLEPFARHESRATRELEPPGPVARPADERAPNCVAGARSPPVATSPALPRESLEQIATRHCAGSGIALAALSSRSRDRQLCDLRQAIAREALACGAANMTEIARFLGRSRSAIAQQLTQLTKTVSGTFRALSDGSGATGPGAGRIRA